MFDVAAFGKAVEPLVIEIEALRLVNSALGDRLDRALAEIETLKGDAAGYRHDLELARAMFDFTAKADVVEALQATVENMSREFLDRPAWKPGVYRQGAIVQHFHGQYFEAVADTAHEPGDGVAWKRLGTHGFRHRGLAIEGVEYEAGDLVARDGGMLLQTESAMHWLVLRGRPGPRGAPGEDGRPGSDGIPGAPGARGADGAMLVKLEAGGGLIWAVMSDGRREPIALEAVAVEDTP